LRGLAGVIIDGAFVFLSIKNYLHCYDNNFNLLLLNQNYYYLNDNNNLKMVHLLPSPGDLLLMSSSSSLMTPSHRLVVAVALSTTLTMGSVSLSLLIRYPVKVTARPASATVVGSWTKLDRLGFGHGIKSNSDSPS
jgi:hypothetical protein